jgi:DNA-binding SARP family transcriptional activator
VHPAGTPRGAATDPIERRTTGEFEALLDGAATLSRSGNHIAAIAALLSAVDVAPDDRTAHRRLAAAYAVAGDPDSARTEYDRFVSRLEARGSVHAAAQERAYANALLPPPAARTRMLPTQVGPHLTRDQAVALTRVAVAIVAVAATLGAMFVAGSQIFAAAGPLGR